MRLRQDAMIKIFNGSTGEWLAKLNYVSQKKLEIIITEKLLDQIPTPKLTLAFCPTKNVNSTYIVEKATELGVTSIQPIISERTIVRKVNMEKLEYSAIEAAEQCERLDIPEIHEITTFNKFMDNLHFKGSLIFFDETKDCLPLKSIQPHMDDNALLIGPEGGFTDFERQSLKNHNKCIRAHLGKRILRADTAAISGLASYQSVFGDWNDK
jgi:16S rRNA (uracil1498-N3)-methyltransferase